ncbi:MAG: hypothetical protein RRC07_10005 [Anaerolineae bacterium]|nr:hypothetical protein [Anaerolineae bacterium]
MRVRLGTLSVALSSEDSPLLTAWEQLFAGWHTDDGAALQLTLRLADELPRPPDGAPLFADPRGIVDVYGAGDSRILHFHSGAMVTLGASHAGGIITTVALEHGQLEDVTYTALAPLLRTRGYYLLHAFAASLHGRAVLLCGGSGSGKTTTGASLLLGGWQLLANDVVLLERRAGRVYALPTPAPVRVRPPTLFLLPALRHRPGRPHAATGSYIFAGEAIAGRGWGQPAPVEALYFTRVASGARHSSLQPLQQAIALAHLVEESVDRWDGQALDAHLALLHDLAQQAAIHRLHLGADVGELPALLAPAAQTEES